MSSNRNDLTLFLGGFLVLFAELAAIRWFPALIPSLQFFSNIILLACFVGMSVGCLISNPELIWLRRFPYFFMASIILVILLWCWVTLLPGAEIGVGSWAQNKMLFFGLDSQLYKDSWSWTSLPVEFVAGLVFIVIALQFVGLGQVVGLSMQNEPNRLRAYTLNVLGSLAGIVLFSLLAWLQSNPSIWFAIVLTNVALLLRSINKLNRRALEYLIASLALVFCLSTSFSPDYRTSWSPYYRITLKEERHIGANMVGQQSIVPRAEGGNAYSLAQLLQRDSGGIPPENILIIGAGNGNDVAHNLIPKHVKRIDAVEIDPVIQDLGRRFHPDRPYQDPRVHVIIEDGRNFIRAQSLAGVKYDLVIFALVDSLLLHSSYSSLRLESFLFTDEGFQDVKRILNPNGIFVAYNYFREEWLVHRLAGTLADVFGKPPLVISLPFLPEIRNEAIALNGMTMMIAGATENIQNAFSAHKQFMLSLLPANNDEVNGFVVEPTGHGAPSEKVAPANVIDLGTGNIIPHDDWPFLYLRFPSLPIRPYVTGILLIGALSVALLISLRPRASSGLDLSMFFLGAGFMLLETRAVVALSMLFGSTWIVNAAVFATVLLLILLGNAIVIFFPNTKLLAYFGGLAISLVINFYFPLNAFIGAAGAIRFIAPCVVALLPVLFASVIFASLFKKSDSPNVALGSNVAGAVLGGLCENLSMILGFRYLALLALCFYLLTAFGSLRMPSSLSTLNRG